MNIAPVCVFLFQSIKESLPESNINTSIKVLDADNNEAILTEHIVTVRILVLTFKVITAINLNTYFLFTEEQVREESRFTPNESNRRVTLYVLPHTPRQQSVCYLLTYGALILLFSRLFDLLRCQCSIHIVYHRLKFSNYSLPPPGRKGVYH